MKVVLAQDIRSLGRKGAILELSDGYARNYLLPQGLALATSDRAAGRILKEIEVSRRRQTQAADSAVHSGPRLVGHIFIFTRPATEAGSLYAGVTAEEIARKIGEFLKINLPAKSVSLPTPIKRLGSSLVEVSLNGSSVPVRIQVNKVITHAK